MLNFRPGVFLGFWLHSNSAHQKSFPAQWAIEIFGKFCHQVPLEWYYSCRRYFQVCRVPLVRRSSLFSNRWVKIRHVTLRSKWVRFNFCCLFKYAPEYWFWKFLKFRMVMQSNTVLKFLIWNGVAVVFDFESFLFRTVMQSCFFWKFLIAERCHRLVFDF